MSALFDAHCHLGDARLSHANLGELLDEARAAGVRHLVVNGTCEGDWPRVAALADSHCCVMPSFGLHPWRVATASPRWEETLQEALERHPRAAVGEAGLHHGAGCDATPTQQAAALATQLRLAAQLRRPVALHCVRAQGALYDTLHAASPPGGFADTGVLLHSYSGSAATCACGTNPRDTNSPSAAPRPGRGGSRQPSAAPLERSFNPVQRHARRDVLGHNVHDADTKGRCCRTLLAVVPEASPACVSACAERPAINLNGQLLSRPEQVKAPLARLGKRYFKVRRAELR